MLVVTRSLGSSLVNLGCVANTRVEVSTHDWDHHPTGKLSQSSLVHLILPVLHHHCTTQASSESREITLPFGHHFLSLISLLHQDFHLTRQSLYHWNAIKFLVHPWTSGKQPQISNWDVFLLLKISFRNHHHNIDIWIDYICFIIRRRLFLKAELHEYRYATPTGKEKN